MDRFTKFCRRNKIIIGIIAGCFIILICIGVLYSYNKDTYKDSVSATKSTERTAKATLTPTNEPALITKNPIETVNVDSTTMPDSTVYDEIVTNGPVETLTHATNMPIITKAPAETKATEGINSSTSNPANGSYLIAIDPGHQAKQNTQKEPIGPGSTTYKAKVSSGTSGVSSGIAEYIVTLQVSLKLRDALTAKGYQVIMTRETHDVNISNAERAQIANNSNADIFIRIHCNGSENSSVRGALTLCQTVSNPYCAQYYSSSRLLSDKIVSALCNETGLKNRGVSETDTMSGINWCSVPVSIIEMGFMSNPEEDLLLIDDSFQNKIVSGIVNGIDDYFMAR